MSCVIEFVGARTFSAPGKPGFYWPFSTGCSDDWRAVNYEEPPAVGEPCPCVRWPEEVAASRSGVVSHS